MLRDALPFRRRLEGFFPTNRSTIILFARVNPDARISSDGRVIVSARKLVSALDAP